MELTVRLADSLFQLLLVGHFKYNSFHKCYFRLAEPSILQGLEQDVKILEADLEKWNAQVEDLRTQYYELNYFSSRQLSLICQQLSVSTDTSSLTKPWFYNLLLSIYPAVRMPLVVRAAKRVAAERERMCQQTMLGLHTRDHEQADDLVDISSANADTTPRSDNVHLLTVDDLDETAKDIFDYLTMMQEYSDEIVLRGLAQFGSNTDAVEEYCMKSGMLEVSLSSKAAAVCPSEVEQSNHTGEHTEHPVIAKMIDQDFPVELIKEAVDKFGDDEDMAFNYCLSEEKNFVARQQRVNELLVSHNIR